MTLTVLSLFDGISCGQVALQRLGIDCVYYASEVDKYAINVTRAHFPDTIHIGDVRKVRYIRHTKQIVCESGIFDVGDIDLLIGGSPCQGFSRVNQKSKDIDFEHSRSQLIYEFERIRNEVRPRYMLLENVSMKQSCVDVISDLMSATHGVKLHKINSSNTYASTDFACFGRTSHMTQTSLCRRNTHSLSKSSSVMATKGC